MLGSALASIETPATTITRARHITARIQPRLAYSVVVPAARAGTGGPSAGDSVLMGRSWGSDRGGCGRGYARPIRTAPPDSKRRGPPVASAFPSPPLVGRVGRKDRAMSVHTVEVDTAEQAPARQAARRRAPQPGAPGGSGAAGCSRAGVRTRRWRRSPATRASASAPSTGTSRHARTSWRPSSATASSSSRRRPTSCSPPTRRGRPSPPGYGLSSRRRRPAGGSRRRRCSPCSTPAPASRPPARRCVVPAPSSSHAAQAAGDVRSGIDIDDLVRMVQAIGLAAEESADPDTANRLFDFMLDGVRVR